MKRESRWAAKLRELGFRKTGENDHASLIPRLEQRAGRKLTRVERRIVNKEKRRPCFTRESQGIPVTQVTDECGWRWIAHGHIDLSHWGFVDQVAFMERLSGVKIQKSPRYH